MTEERILELLDGQVFQFHMKEEGIVTFISCISVSIDGEMYMVGLSFYDSTEAEYFANNKFEWLYADMHLFEVRRMNQNGEEVIFTNPFNNFNWN